MHHLTGDRLTHSRTGPHEIDSTVLLRPSHAPFTSSTKATHDHIN